MSSSLMQWSAPLHDATLVSVEIDWPNGIAQLKVKADQGRHFTLWGRGVRLLVLPRAQPWGPSASINTITGPSEQSAGSLRVAIELQSGDELVLEAESIELIG